MWTKFSHALKSKQAQDGDLSAVLESPTDELAGPSRSPSKSTGRKGVLRDGSLRLNSPLKLHIPKKVKSTFSLHGNSSQLTLTSETSSESSRELSRRASQEVLNTSRPKAARRSSFNILTRRPSIDALRSPPETPRSATPRDYSSFSSNSHHTRNRAATFGGSVRSILREPNTPGTGKNVRFFAHEEDDFATPAETEYQPTIARSTPPDETFLQQLHKSDSANSNAASAGRRSASSSRFSRPSVAEVFSPFASQLEPQEQTPHLTNFFDKLDVSAISSLTVGLHVPNNDLPDALTSTPFLDGAKGSNGEKDIGLAKGSPGQTVTDTAEDKAPRLPPISHDRSASFSFGQTVFHSMEHPNSKRSSSGKSSLISNVDSDMTSGSSSPSIGRNRSHSDTVFMSMMRGSNPKASEGTNSEPVAGGQKAASEPDPFSANATTYYTPQTMIPTTPPQGTSRHVRRASEEESIIFSLQTQLDLQNELCGQFEADLRAQDEFVEVLGKRLAEAEEEDAKKRKLLRGWKKKVAELEKTCRFLEDEVEGSRQDSMDRSIMDEASSEALQMLHRQISGLEREREGWKRTETVLREEVRRLETLAGERRSEAAMLRESLGKKGKQKEEQQMADDAVKRTVAAMEEKINEEKQRHEAVEIAWQLEKEDFLVEMNKTKVNNIGLVAEMDDFKQQLRARDEEVAALKAELTVTCRRAENTAAMLEATEGGKCALAMERDSLKLQVVKLQEKNATAELAGRKVFELEDDLQELGDAKESLEQEREHLQERIREEEGRVEAISQKLKASQNRVIELEQDSQRNLQHATDIEDMSRIRREQSAALEAALQDAANKQTEINAQSRALLEFKAEVERLTGQTRELQQESADKEVCIVQITKQRAQDKQDLEGLNIALDSKQQELELLKRRLGVRGTTGNTPAQTSKTVHQRRDSSVYATPRMSRPSSFTSESGVLGHERKPSVEGPSKTPALSKSMRSNTSAAVLPTPLKSARGTMGPPPLRSRSSIVGTPPNASKTLARRSSSVACSPASATGVKSRVSKPTSHPVEPSEKENADASGSKRLSRIPTLAPVNM
ncbi:hypothetical protein C8R44DRAFT_890910 [Mycena epipterygia]|nr:hypothetical protein C8R44DRAFT_890910 [Mycena epipterygia]